MVVLERLKSVLSFINTVQRRHIAVIILITAFFYMIFLTHGFYFFFEDYGNFFDGKQPRTITLQEINQNPVLRRQGFLFIAD